MKSGTRNSAPVPWRDGPARRRVWISVLAVLLAFTFLGMRGIWDPDEGRYTNVALNMLDSGDWLEPHRHHETGHWTKPPLTYWAIATSVAAFGRDPWAARLPAALAYLLSAWLAWRIARRLTPGAEDMAALAYATMLLPFGASGLITTDFLLAASETLAVWAFVEARFGPGRRVAGWLVLMWVGFALAFLTKGPPALLPLLVMAIYGWLVPRERGHRLFDSAGLAVFLLLALPWFVAVTVNNPGLHEYFNGDEEVNRVTTDKFGRHGQWYGWLVIYVPTLLLGTVPWTADLWRWAKSLPTALRAWRAPAVRDAQRITRHEAHHHARRVAETRGLDHLPVQVAREAVARLRRVLRVRAEPRPADRRTAAQRPARREARRGGEPHDRRLARGRPGEHLRALAGDHGRAVGIGDFRSQRAVRAHLELDFARDPETPVERDGRFHGRLLVVRQGTRRHCRAVGDAAPIIGAAAARAARPARRARRPSGTAR